MIGYYARHPTFNMLFISFVSEVTMLVNLVPALCSKYTLWCELLLYRTNIVHELTARFTEMIVVVSTLSKR